MFQDEFIQEELCVYYHEPRQNMQTLTPMLLACKDDNGDESPDNLGGLDDASVSGALHPRPECGLSVVELFQFSTALCSCNVVILFPEH